MEVQIDSFLKKFEKKKKKINEYCCVYKGPKSAHKYMSKVSNEHSFAKCAHLRLRHNDIFIEVISCCYCWLWTHNPCWKRYYVLHKKCPYSKLFSSVFSRIRTKYEETLRISPYSVRTREKTDQNNSEYGLFSRSDGLI